MAFSLNRRVVLMSVPSNTGVLSDFYKDDINVERLQLHTAMLHNFVEQKQQTINNFGDIVNILRTEAAIHSLLPELEKCI